MHEASLVSDLIRRIDAVRAQEHAARVAGVTVWLGAFSNFSPEHFKDHFKAAAAGGPLAQAELTVWSSEDAADPRASDVLLISVDVAD